jgi:hypothetical protein
MLLSRHNNTGQTHDMEAANGTFENVARFRYLETTVTNQNLIHEEIKRRSNSGSSCYNSVQNLSSSRLLYKNVKIRIQCQVYQWRKTGFGLVVGFINHLQVVTTNNYYAVTDFHTLKHSTLSLQSICTGVHEYTAQEL